jgi:hypothetical protein
MIKQALNSLRPFSKWVIKNDIITWLDETQTQPTVAEIDAEIERLIPILEAYQLSIKSKKDRQIACDDLVITITNGKQFNGDKKAIADLKNAIETSREYAILYPNEAPLTETTWKIYDNDNSNSHFYRTSRSLC